MQIKNILILLALLLLSVTVYAGYALSVPVEIEYYEGGGSARGDMISARNSENENEFIGCGTRAFEDAAGGVWYWGFCQASVEAEVNVSCFVYDNVALMEGINTISDASYITFSWVDNGDGDLTCDSVGSSTQSFYLQKGKKTKKTK